MSQRTRTRRKIPILWWGFGIAAATAVGAATWWIASRAAGTSDPSSNSGSSSRRPKESDRSTSKKKTVVIVIQDEQALTHIPPLLHPHTSNLILLAPHTLPPTSLTHAAQTLLASPHNLIQYQSQAGAGVGVPSIIRHLGPDVVVFLGEGGYGEWVEGVRRWVGRVVVVDEEREGEGGRRGNVEVVKVGPGEGEEGVGWWMQRV